MTISSYSLMTSLLIIPNIGKELSSQPSIVSSTGSSRSLLCHNWDSPHVDPLAVVEASLTSVKYAFYQTLGYIIVNAFGYHDPSTTILSASFGGFIGGAIFTIPYLILLLPMFEDHSHSTDPILLSFGRRHAKLLGTEMLYSAVAGGMGMITIDGYGRDKVLMGVLRGLGGPLISFSLLFIFLKIALSTVSMILKDD